MSLLGTVMYFSPDGSHAFVWPDTPDCGPALLRKADFPALWGRVRVGEVLQFTVSETSGVGLVRTVSRIGAEALEPPVAAVQSGQAAASLSDCWRDQSCA